MTIESKSLSYSGQAVKLLPAICMCEYQRNLITYEKIKQLKKN